MRNAGLDEAQAGIKIAGFMVQLSHLCMTTGKIIALTGPLLAK